MIRRSYLPYETQFGIADLNQDQQQFRLNRVISKNRYRTSGASAAKIYIPTGVAQQTDVEPGHPLAKFIGYQMEYAPENYTLQRDDIIRGYNEKNKTVKEVFLQYHLQDKETRYLFMLDGKLRSRLSQDFAPSRINLCIDAETNRILRIFWG